MSCDGGDSDLNLALSPRLGGGEGERENERERERESDREKRLESGARYGDRERDA